MRAAPKSERRRCAAGVLYLFILRGLLRYGEVNMRCVLKRTEGCMFEECRYFKQHACILENLHWTAWPSPDERLKETAMAKTDKTGEEYLTAGRNRRPTQ